MATVALNLDINVSVPDGSDDPYGEAARIVTLAFECAGDPRIYLVKSIRPEVLLER